MRKIAKANKLLNKMWCERGTNGFYAQIDSFKVEFDTDNFTSVNISYGRCTDTNNHENDWSKRIKNIFIPEDLKTAKSIAIYLLGCIERNELYEFED